MKIMNFLAAHPVAFISMVILLSLAIGSFLNVVIYRLPIILKNQWRRQCQELLDLKKDNKEKFDLCFPASHCPSCKSSLTWWHNIPLVSYLILRGKCFFCKSFISYQYPTIELVTATLSALVVWHFGFSAQTLFGLVLTWTLIALVFIDFAHQLLPDTITLPFLWIGLLVSTLYLFTDMRSAIIGAVAGYLSLWIVAAIFKYFRGVDGMGHGDFKLNAMLGAWLGWHMLPLIIMLAAILGGIVATLLMLTKKATRHSAIAFGPYLAISGWVSMLWGIPINLVYLHYLGIH